MGGLKVIVMWMCGACFEEEAALKLNYLEWHTSGGIRVTITKDKTNQTHKALTTVIAGGSLGSPNFSPCASLKTYRQRVILITPNSKYILISLLCR